MPDLLRDIVNSTSPSTDVYPESVYVHNVDGPTANIQFKT
ncbi:MAG: hypothetical protein ACI9MC_000834 [Kiritimatiellia bacterium]|jgi:hypothetical protein